MLKKENRLKKQKDFERVFKQGKYCKQDLIFLRVEKNDVKVSRFGFIVSKKVSKKAVVRNKVKRRMREVIKKRLLCIEKGIDVVLSAIPGLEEKSFNETETMINKALEKLKIISKQI